MAYGTFNGQHLPRFRRYQHHNRSAVDTNRNRKGNANATGALALQHLLVDSHFDEPHRVVVVGTPDGVCFPVGFLLICKGWSRGGSYALAPPTSSS